MPRLPAPINWIRQRNQPDDLLMTYSETQEYDYENKRYREDLEYSQIMGPAEVKDFLSNLVNVWLDSLELTTITVEMRDSDGMQVYDESGLEIYEEQERLVPQWNNGKAVIFFIPAGQQPGESPNFGTWDEDFFIVGKMYPFRINESYLGKKPYPY